MSMDDLSKLLGGAGGEGGAGLQGLMQQAQQMQQQMVEAQKRAQTQVVTGEAAAGMVKVTANGAGEIVSAQLDPAVVDPDDIDMLQDLFVAAANDALIKAKAMMQQEMGPMADMLKQTGFSL